MGEAAVVIEQEVYEQEVVWTLENDVNYLATGTTDDDWKYGSD